MSSLFVGILSLSRGFVRCICIRVAREASRQSLTFGLAPQTLRLHRQAVCTRLSLDHLCFRFSCLGERRRQLFVELHVLGNLSSDLVADHVTGLGEKSGHQGRSFFLHPLLTVTALAIRFTRCHTRISSREVAVVFILVFFFVKSPAISERLERAASLTDDLRHLANLALGEVIRHRLLPAEDEIVREARNILELVHQEVEGHV